MLAAAPASASTTVNYVALGDSYSSGVGAGNYSDGSCMQSSNAYPVLWAQDNAPASFANETCSGATTSDVINNQLGPLNSGTSLVSITIGGNDVGFADVMTTCVLFSTSTCVSAINAAEDLANSILPGNLNAVLSAIAQAAPHAHVVVMGYPELYDLSKSSTCVGLSTTDRTDLNQAADLLDSLIQQAAARYDDTYANIQPAFANHEICDSSSWLHSVDWFDLDVSYHPTAHGQAYAYLPVFSAAA